MTNFRVKQDLDIQKTEFDTIQDLYDFFIDNNILVEFWEVDEKNLSVRLKLLLARSRNSKNRINI